MSADPNILLHWASHRGTFTGQQWRDAVAVVARWRDDEAEMIFRAALIKRMRLLCHVTELDGHYQTYLPCLAAAEPRTGGDLSVFWCGARVPALVRHAERVAAKHGCAWNTERLSCAPDRLSLTGSAASLAACASELGVRLAGFAARRALTHINPLPNPVSQSNKAGSLPPAARVETFDFDSGTWCVKKPGKYAAQKYKPQFDATRYYYAECGVRYNIAEAGTAILLAADRSRIPVCEYDTETAMFVAPRDLPFAAARALCLCSGYPPVTDLRTNRQIYRDVPSGIAAVVLERLGQYELVVKPAIVWLHDGLDRKEKRIT